MLTLQKRNDEGFTDPIKVLVVTFPSWPSIVKYYDEFDDAIRSIHDIENSNKITVLAQGISQTIHFSELENYHSQLLKRVLIYLLSEDLSPRTVVRYINDSRSITREMLSEFISSNPKNIAFVWQRMLAIELPRHAYTFAKGLLRFLSVNKYQGWSNDYIHLISHTLPFPAYDKYSGVRSGDVFLSIDEEAAIVRFLDDYAENLKKHPDLIGIDDLCDASILVCTYQFGMRPLQIASVKMKDVRIWDDGDPTNPSVHITFPMIKQKTASNSKPLTRKIKYEWSIIIRHLQSANLESGASGEYRFFGIRSGQKASLRIKFLLDRIIGEGATATDLRHTAAQRLVDAGASHEELAEFMGHSDITTGLVYFDASNNQAERVNKALGLSNIFSKVVKIAHSKFIDEEELANLKEDQQIAGAPHGIMVTGIGGCSSGQPVCPSNPILACYGCNKFMPIFEIDVHQQVLADFREVVKFFHSSSRNDQESPAYLQLQRTISSIQSIIDELHGEMK